MFLCWLTFKFYKNIQNVTNVSLLFLPQIFGYESFESVPTDIFDLSCLDAIFIQICSYTMIFVTVATALLGVSLLPEFYQGYFTDCSVAIQKNEGFSG